jgi:hypothetical protein
VDAVKDLLGLTADYATHAAIGRSAAAILEAAAATAGAVAS